MATVSEHYDKVLSDVYAWIYGGFETALKRNSDFFKKHNISPIGSSIAIDLGAGCGFQSIPLAQAGYQVTAIDFDAKLLKELLHNRGDLPIRTIQDDLLNFDVVSPQKAELIVCMTDTIVHLESEEAVLSVFHKIYEKLENRGKFVLTFRDLTHELKDEERFLPVKSDDSTIFTCFLEYEPVTVKVHDIVYKKSDSGWLLHKSFYRKLRLSESWVYDQLSGCGFASLESSVEDGFITLIAVK